jgi:acetoacetate decarboxylase
VIATSDAATRRSGSVSANHRRERERPGSTRTWPPHRGVSRMRAGCNRSGPNDSDDGLASNGMGKLEGFVFPRSATGRASLVPPPPWHYSGQMLTIEYRADPAAVAELLPDPLRPADDDPGAVAVIWADWQSCSDSFEELVDPVRSQYMEVFVVVRCRYRDETYSRCVYIWVDTDFAMVRGHHQGYPKKLGELYLTRAVRFGRAGPRLEPGGRFGATCSAGARRLIDATFTITGDADSAGFVNGHPMLHHRFFPSIESDGTDSLHELVTMRGYDAEVGPCFRGDATIELHPSPTEELERLRPIEMIGGYWREVGTSWNGGTTLERGGATGP